MLERIVAMREMHLPPPHKPMLPRLLLLLSCLLLAGCGSNTQHAAAPPPRVTVSQPEQKTVTDYIDAPGNLHAFQRVSLVARVKGYLQSIDFQDGAMVHKGQLLFVIEPDPFEARLSLAKAAVTQQEAVVARDREEYQRQLRMIKKKATSQASVQKWRAQYHSAQALLEQDRARVKLAQINLGYTRVVAPFDGRMQRHLVDAGNLVGVTGSTKLATIYRLNPIYAYFSLNEYDLNRLTQSMRATQGAFSDPHKIPVLVGTEAEQGYPHRGTLDYASAALEQTTATLQLRAVIPNPIKKQVPSLFPGMYVRVRIPLGVHKNALLVPEDALGIIQGRHYLLTVNDHHVVVQRFVTIGRKVNDLRVIEKGVKKSDWVVVSGLQRARPGSKVTPEHKHNTGS